MIKDQLTAILKVVENECKRGCEQSFYEEDRDTWSKHHDYIKKMRLDLEKGRFK
jgi:hypothetical protein